MPPSRPSVYELGLEDLHQRHEGAGLVGVVHAVAAPGLQLLLALGALRALEGQRVAVPAEERETISNNPDRTARFRQSK